MIDLAEVVQWIPGAAIVVAAIAYFFREFEAWRSRKRELKGLLRLLAVEIEYNENILEAFKNSRSHLGEHPQGLHIRAWEENRGRIAQLLERGEDFGDLADYFMNVATFEEYRLRGQEWAVSLSESIASLEQQGEDAMKVVTRGTGGKVEPRVEVPALEAPTEASREAAETAPEPQRGQSLGPRPQALRRAYGCPGGGGCSGGDEGPKTMQLLKAMRGQLGDASASRSVDAVAAAEDLGMDPATPDFDRRLQDLVRAGYLEPDPNTAAPAARGLYRITFAGLDAADSY